ncbi:MAG: GSU2403 family nucleotidyltransferase fold protein [Kiritimatiellia bacterium]
MEKKKYKLCLEVLRRMKQEGILDKILLVGSWCVLLYEDYFKGKGLLPPLRTRDLEFLVSRPPRIGRKTDLGALLKDLGFVEDYKGRKGYITLNHPDLILEFLVPARGRESDRPYTIDELGINAQPLRYMDMLAQNPIQMLFGDIAVNLPHPANFALHKLLIAGRRKNREKAEKDRAQAVAILAALNATADFKRVRTLYQASPRSWQKNINRELTALGEHDILALVQGTRKPDGS